EQASLKSMPAGHGVEPAKPPVVGRGGPYGIFELAVEIRGLGVPLLKRKIFKRLGECHPAVAAPVQRERAVENRLGRGFKRTVRDGGGTRRAPDCPRGRRDVLRGHLVLSLKA